VPPRLHRHPTAAASFVPDNGGQPAGHWAVRPFLPALRRVFTLGRDAAFPATGSSLGSRDPGLLVSVIALKERLGGEHPQRQRISPCSLPVKAPWRRRGSLSLRRHPSRLRGTVVLDHSLRPPDVAFQSLLPRTTIASRLARLCERDTQFAAWPLHLRVKAAPPRCCCPSLRPRARA
jgi:hypothetical protein